MKMDENDDLLPEYDFDYSKSKPNRFAEEYNRMRKTIVLDADVAENFSTSEAVNDALRFLMKIKREGKAIGFKHETKAELKEK